MAKFKNLNKIYDYIITSSGKNVNLQIKCTDGITTCGNIICRKLYSNSIGKYFNYKGEKHYI